MNVDEGRQSATAISSSSLLAKVCNDFWKDSICMRCSSRPGDRGKVLAAVSSTNLFKLKASRGSGRFVEDAMGRMPLKPAFFDASYGTCDFTSSDCAKKAFSYDNRGQVR